ncbi:TlpA disulfide reductase family protein [Spirosoma sp. SC4-14]|uniref:TlpA family protein disulfide reductase n=1 Tax=Spirosoma sp. SC4-14 TaxID=3128900 RepID=UPI0030CE727A
MSVRYKWENKLFPAFSLENKRGDFVDNASLKGKIAVFNFWSVTCIPCLEEMPYLNKLVEKYRSNDVIFLAPLPENRETINKVLLKNRFDYTIIPEATSLFSSLDMPGYPYHLIVDRDGVIRYIQTGTINTKTGKKIAESDLPEAIDRILN